MAQSFIVKVCGVTNAQDAQAAIDAGANAIGFNFHPKSPRYLTYPQAEAIMRELHGNFLRVGVFVHPNSQDFAAASSLMDVAQIHGSGNTEMTAWRALSAGAVPPPDNSVSAWLLDTFTPAFGGSGQTFDWAIAARFPYPAIIAGGLDASNVADAIRIAQPWEWIPVPVWSPPLASRITSVWQLS